MNKIDGILNINKPAGWTSQDVCAKLRGRLHIKKIGHTGTLDPMATGVLPVCIGKATRIIEYYDKDMKSYHASMKLGLTTDTLDITGEVISENAVRITAEAGYAVQAEVSGNAGTAEHAECSGKSRDTENVLTVSAEDINKAFKEYTGRISQIPPKYSALKVNGKRAYDLARDGKDFELKAREVLIPSNEVYSIDAENGIIEFDVSCSKGTYIRTICDDIGRMLGCGAVMTSLVRTGSGYFCIENAVDPEKLVEMADEEIASLVIPMDATLFNLGCIELDSRRAGAFRNGNPSAAWSWSVTRETGFDELYRVYDRISGAFLGIGRTENGELIPQKVLI
ncbi:MAG: tRNA pseudouridine(55) synthase TruB [Mogibacterium sp.]|nr:tRNA pseudouridine(55) synthase TruB [Mogibacterium sp.]